MKFIAKVSNKGKDKRGTVFCYLFKTIKNQT